MRRMKRIVSIVAAVTLLIAASGGALNLRAEAENKADATLTTQGNQLVNGSGEAVRLMGFNVPYMSWSDNCEEAVMESVRICIDEWEGNAVRLAVTPEMWFGSNSASYRALADKVIETVSAAGKYVILDNHSFYLPDESDVAFWADAAVRYKDHPYVVYELFNEPAGCTWQQYYEGGTLTYTGKNDWGEDVSVTVESCGMPKLLETVRGTGAKNVCILPGINWSFDLSYCTEENFREFAKSVAEEQRPGDVEGFVEEYVEKYFMAETDGNGIMYSTHPYPTKPADWDQYLLDTILEYPVLVGECGPTEKANGFVRTLTDGDKSYLDTLTAYTDEYELNITPWAWGAWPYLNQEPSNKLSAYGSYMKDYFETSNKTKAVTLYSEIDYQGESVTMEAGTYSGKRLKEMGFDITKLNSVSCKEDYYQYTVTVYEKEDFSGKSYTFVPKASNVGTDVSGFEAASIKIERGVPENLLTDHSQVTAPGSVENNEIENVIDGKNSTFWKYISEEPVEVILSLDGVYALNRIGIAHASEASMMSIFNASEYTVSVSTDGKNFTRIIDVTNNSMGLCEYNFEQVLASYIKITLTKGSTVDDTVYHLAEVMAYGTAYNGSLEHMSVSIGEYPTTDVGSETKEAMLPVILLIVFGGIILLSLVSTTVCLIVKRKR
mgnify:CR=1 FL=1